MKKTVCLLALLSMTLAGCASKLSPAEQQFVDKLGSQGFDASEVGNTLKKAEKRDDIIALMTKPAESKPWKTYRPIFMTDSRLQNGLAFWREHQTTLNRVAAEYGVAPEYIVSIIGIETNYGRFVGKHRVLDALYTLAFHYPPRSPYFTGELEQFFLLSREQQWDMTQPIGSYAGAMGYGQFMPTSYRKWAVDADGNQRIDLFQSPTDAIASVANYFIKHGWQTGGAVMTKVQMPAVYPESMNFPKRDLAPLQDLLAVGAKAELPLAPHWHAVLLSYEEEQGIAHYIGYNNFRVLTRYNRSPMYARVVHEFAQQLNASMSAG